MNAQQAADVFAWLNEVPAPGDFDPLLFGLGLVIFGCIGAAALLAWALLLLDRRPRISFDDPGQAHLGDVIVLPANMRQVREAGFTIPRRGVSL
jgi:hypothetical protein